MASRGLRSRFNLLLLEEGEWLLEEVTALAWVVYPSSDGRTLDAASVADPSSKGRLRIGTRGVFFEPENASLPIIKYGFRQMKGRPCLMPDSTVATSLQPLVKTMPDASSRSFIVLQAGEVTEMKPSNVIGPYKTRTFEDHSAAATAPAASGKGGKGGKGAAAAASKAAEAAAALKHKEGAHALGRTTVVFALLGGTPISLAQLLQQLWSLQQTAAKSHSGYERAQLEPILSSRRDGPFDMTLLPDFREKPLTPTVPLAISVERVFPLLTVPGRLLVTDKAVYLQPVALNNIAGSDPVAKWLLKDVKRVLRRRRLLAETGLELQLSESAGAGGASGSGTSTGSDIAAAGLRPNSAWATSVFFAFANRTQRDEVYRIVLGALRQRARAPPSSGLGSLLHRTASAGGFGASPMTPGGSSAGGLYASPSAYASDAAADGGGDYDDELGDPSPAGIEAVTRLWQQNSVSNYDYLFFLNSAAGRSLIDLTQYPVFPWVIADYTSSSLDLTSPSTFRDLGKPVGALNAARLTSVKQRYEAMQDMPGEQPFMWGTHFSTPGYVLYYMVRSCAEHMLRLQSGRFDAPDRLFYDVSVTFSGVTSTNMDVKELVPEFYRGDGSFLLMPEAGGATLDLGVRQNGRRVADVSLPPWAYDGGDFVAQCREALECDYVSERLHSWIDLIFGYKQRGPEAVAADNVFHPVTYGSVDLEAMESADARAAVQAQIAEFGQMPLQLFTQPHVCRSGPLLLRPPGAAGREDDEVDAANNSGGVMGPASSPSTVASGTATDSTGELLDSTLTRLASLSAQGRGRDVGDGGVPLLPPVVDRRKSQERLPTTEEALEAAANGEDLTSATSSGAGNPFATEQQQSHSHTSPAPEVNQQQEAGELNEEAVDRSSRHGSVASETPLAGDDVRDNGAAPGSARGSVASSRRGSVVDATPTFSSSGSLAKPSLTSQSSSALLSEEELTSLSFQPMSLTSSGPDDGSSLLQHMEAVSAAIAIAAPASDATSANPLRMSLRRRMSAGTDGNVMQMLTSSWDGTVRSSTIAVGGNAVTALGDDVTAVPAPAAPPSALSSQPLHAILHQAVVGGGAPLPVTCMANVSLAAGGGGAGDAPSANVALAGCYNGSIAAIDAVSGAVLGSVTGPDSLPVTALATVPVAPRKPVPAAHRFGPASPEMATSPSDSASHFLVFAAHGGGGTVRVWRLSCDRSASGSLTSSFSPAPLAEVAYHASCVTAMGATPATRWSDSGGGRVVEKDTWLLATGDKSGRIALHCVSVRRPTPRTMRRQAGSASAAADDSGSEPLSVDADTIATCDVLHSLTSAAGAGAHSPFSPASFSGIVSLTSLADTIAGSPHIRRFVAISADGRLGLLHAQPASGGRGADVDGVDLWLSASATTGKAVCSAAVDAANAQLACTGGYDGQVRLWRVDKLATAAADGDSPVDGLPSSGSAAAGKGGAGAMRRPIQPPVLPAADVALATVSASDDGPSWVSTVTLLPPDGQAPYTSVLAATKAGALRFFRLAKG